jgi:hypothetical protein
MDGFGAVASSTTGTGARSGDLQAVAEDDRRPARVVTE